MGKRTSTLTHGLLLMFVAFLASTSISLAQNAANRQKVSYVKQVDDNGNEVLYEVIDQPIEAAKTRTAVQVQENDELQKLIDRLADAPATRAATTVTDIDLSAYSEPRATTLYIRNGVNVRFVNGTLTRAKSLTDGPLVQIIGDSRLHLAATAAISGNNFYTSGGTLVEVLDGRLDVEGGKITGNKSLNTIGISVSLRNKDAVVWVEDGEVENLSSGVGTAYAFGGTIGWLSVYNCAYLGDNVKADCSFSRKEAYLDATKIGSSASINLYYYYQDQTVVKNVFQDAINCFKLGYSENVSGSASDYVLSLEDKSLIVRSKASADPNLIYNEEQLRNRLKEIADNKESSASKPVKLTVAPEGFSISSSVLVSSCFVEISGGRITVAKNTSHSPFMVEKGAGLILNNIEIDFNKYDSYYRGFDNNGGTLTIGEGTVFLNAASSKWYEIPFYYLFAGTTTISPTNRNVENEVFSIYFSKFQDNVVQFTSSLDYARISGRWDSFDSDEPYTLIKGSGYTLKESDFKKMRFEGLPDKFEIYYDSSDYSVKLRKFDPDYITDEDWLQKRLDEIAKSDNKKAELTIAEQGITLTKGVYVRAETDVTLTGGTISLANTFSDDAAFYLEKRSGLTYSNIKFNLNNVYLPTSFVRSLEYSVLCILDNVEFMNIYNGSKAMATGFFNCAISIAPQNGIFSLEVNRGSVLYGIGGEMHLRNCSLKSNGGYPTITGDGDIYMNDNSKIYGDGKASAVVDLPQGGFSMYYGKDNLVHADGNGSVVKAHSGDLGSGKLEGGEATFEYIRISEGIDFDLIQLTLSGSGEISGNVKLPRLYVMNGVQIKLTSAMTDTWIIDGDWNSFELTEPYTLLTGYNKYTLTESDYNRMQFANLPDNVEALHNKEIYAVVLQKKTPTINDILQCLVDGRPDCKTDEDLEVPEGGIDIGCEDALQCAVDATLDGSDITINKWPTRPKILFCDCDRPIGRVYWGSSLTIRNFDIEATRSKSQYFQVYGTLVIDVNVYIYRFIRFIHIMRGGYVIWRGGHVEDVDEIVYNEGGTLEIDGDFDNGGKTLVNPEDGTIIIKGGTFNGGIENHGTVIIEGGTIIGGIENYGTITVTGGTIDGGRKPGLTNYDGGTATIDGGVIKCDGGAIYEIENHEGGNMVLHDGACVGDNGTGCLRSETDIWIGGGVRVTEIYIKRGVRIHVIGKLNVTWRIFFFDFNDFDVYVPFIFGDEGYEMTEEDFRRLEIRLPEGYRLEFYEGSVVIVRIPYNVTTIVEYLEYFGPHGTPGNPWSFVYNTTNIDIDIDWHIKKDYHLIFDGGTFTMNGGDIYIDEGASLWLKNITFKGTGHIYVYGTLYIDANVDFAEILRFIHICKGGVIRFITQPSYIVRIFIEEERIVVGDVVIYDVLEEWLKTLTIELPDGYEWEYDESLHTILIKKTEVDGILDVKSDAVQSDIYDLYGRKVENPIEGKLYIREGKKFVIRK